MKAGADLVLQFKTFHEEFKKFLKEHNLSTTIYNSPENKFPFEMHLSQIYADTPLIIDRKIKISWFGQAGEESFGGSFRIEDIVKLGAQDTSELIA